MLTSACTGKFNQPQNGIVARDGFEGDIRMPIVLAILPLRGLDEKGLAIKLLGLNGADDADLVVGPAQLTARVAHRVDVKPRGAGLATEFA